MKKLNSCSKLEKKKKGLYIGKYETGVIGEEQICLEFKNRSLP